MHIAHAQVAHMKKKMRLNFFLCFFFQIEKSHPPQNGFNHHTSSANNTISSANVAPSNDSMGRPQVVNVQVNEVHFSATR